MKKTLLISFGTLLILVIVGVWIYLFMYGAPKNSDEVFSNFGFGAKESPVFLGGDSSSVVDTSPITDDGVKQRLRQLTTRPVAGAIFIDGGIRYVERGTGYVYDITFGTGDESLVSNTTIPRAVEAIFSENGERVAITYEENDSRTVVVGTIISGGTLDGKTLPEGAREIAFTETDNELYYLLADEIGSTGYLYNVDKNASKELFSLPLRDIRVIWGDPLYVYTTPSATQNGFVYRVISGAPKYVSGGGRGLVVIPYGAGLITSINVGGTFASGLRNYGGGFFDLPLSLLSEKCVRSKIITVLLFCAAPQEQIVGDNFPDNWYTGLVSLRDVLWQIDAGSGHSELMIDLFGESGREIDVSQIGINENEDALYFINKNDDTLWMYDSTL